MKTEQPKKSCIAAIWRYMNEHPIRSILIGLPIYVIVGFGLVLAISSDTRKGFLVLMSRIFGITLIAMVVTLPIIDLQAAQGDLLGLNGQLNDTNIYAALFVVSPPSMPASMTTTSYPTLSFKLTSVSNKLVPPIENLYSEVASTSDNMNALMGSLGQYGLTFSGADEWQGYSAFGLNGSPTTNIPAIVFDPVSGSVSISNGTTNLYTVVFMRSTSVGPGVSWTPIYTNTIPAGYHEQIMDGNPPLGQAFYQTVVMPTVMLFTNSVSGGVRSDWIVPCAVAIVIIVVGTVVIVKLYSLCHAYLPPTTTNTYNPTNND